MRICVEFISFCLSTMHSSGSLRVKDYLTLSIYGWYAKRISWNIFFSPNRQAIHSKQWESILFCLSFLYAWGKKKRKSHSNRLFLSCSGYVLCSSCRMSFPPRSLCFPQHITHQQSQLFLLFFSPCMIFNGTFLLYKAQCTNCCFYLFFLFF